MLTILLLSPQAHATSTSFSDWAPLLGTGLAIVGLCTVLAVVGAARERRREREALYRHETARKLIDAGQMTFDQFAAFERAEAERPLAARRRASTVIGSVLVLAGLGAFIAMEEFWPEQPPDYVEVEVFALIPIGFGAALLLHAIASTLYTAIANRLGRKP